MFKGKKQYSKNNSIVFTGKVPWENVPKYYLMSNVFATASTSETQGLTVIEASAASLAPVVINDESFTSVVIDDLNGKIFNNKKEYIKIIEELMNDKNKLKKLSNQARISSETYSSKYYASRVLDVYNTAIKSSGRKKGILKYFKNKKDKDEK